MQLSTTPLEVIYLRTTSLKPDPRNPRVHSDKQVRQIAQSIESFGFNVPLLIDDEQKVIAGHGRLLAARKLGWDTIPAIRLSHLTESQRMAFLIADNRLTENSSWDERMLGEQLKILSELELDFDLEAIGFEVNPKAPQGRDVFLPKSSRSWSCLNSLLFYNLQRES